MMKILSIIGSQRKNGNTSTVIDLIHENILKGSDNSNYTLEKLYLSDYSIEMCKGCRVCFDRGEEKCPLKDDLLKIKKQIEAHDILILSSPVYVEDISGTLKNWIDRMAFICHRPQFYEKSAFILSTSGVGSTSHPLKTMNRALRTWGFSIIGSDSFLTGALMKKDELKDVYYDKLGSIAHKIIHYHGKHKQLFPDFISLLTFKIQQLYYEKCEDKDSVDYLYWQSKGWLNKETKFYSDIKSNTIKIALARMSGSLLARLVLK